MKRIVPLLLSLLLAGCLLIPGSGPLAQNAGSTPAPSRAPEQTPEAGASPRAVGPFLQYEIYDRPCWEELISEEMFRVDLDQDGAEEPVSFALDREAWRTAITWGESTVTIDSDELVAAAVLDLDTTSPFYNLLVMVDCGSDSYVTVELHPENGRLTKGRVVEGGWTWAEGALRFSQRTDFLGTAYGERAYRGDDLLPDSEWLDMCYIPTEQDLKTQREALIDGGILLHTVRPVPCTIDGQPGLIPADTYVYRTRFRAGDELAEVCLPDGTLAQIACTLGEHGWPYLIDGQDITDCFDNLFFAD